MADNLSEEKERDVHLFPETPIAARMAVEPLPKKAKTPAQFRGTRSDATGGLPKITT